MEYCCFSYAWVGRGWTQEIKWLRQQSDEQPEWRGRPWIEFLNYMGEQGWELVSTVPLGSGQNPVSGVMAYFGRSPLGKATPTR